MNSERVVVVGDAHLGSAAPEDERAFHEFLAAVPEFGTRLLILGDLFDFWFEYRHAIPKGTRARVVCGELWGAKGDDPQAYNEFVDNYRTVLSRLSTRGVVHAGYVEKPTADLVLYLLEIAVATEQDLRRIRDYHPLRGVSDRWLYGERRAPLLPPGHRSAVFKLVSGSDKNYTGALSLHFFYLNVGSEGHPWPVRVEIPRWVVDDRLKLDLLHCVLLEQCKIMGHRPYPYILHRAHETAVVKHDEKLQITEMLAQELRQREEEMDDISNKQNAKNLPGRRRR